MSFPKMTDDMDIIAALGDEPNEDDGLTAAGLKAVFDRAGKLCKTALNNLVNALHATTAAGNVGFQSSEAVPADNVQAAIENVQGQLVEVSQDGVANNSITADKIHGNAVTTEKIQDEAVSLAKLGPTCFMEDVTSDMNLSWESVSSANTARGELTFFYSPLLNMVFVTGNVVFNYTDAQQQAEAHITFSSDYLPHWAIDNVSVLNWAQNCDGFAQIEQDFNTPKIHVGVSNVQQGSTPSLKIHGWFVCEEAS